MSKPGRCGLVALELSKSYRGRSVVDRVSFSVEPGEVVGLLGPNGAGKTTSFLMVVGLVRPDGGRVLMGEVDLTRAPVHLRARAGLGYLPQEPSIFRRMTVRENLLAVLELRKDLNDPGAEVADRLIGDFDLARVSRSTGDQLSGGERRRVEIARCLAGEPQILLLDEPFQGIDPRSVAELQELIQGLRDRGLGILITDHNVRETLRITDRAYVIADGVLVDQGSPKAIASSEKAQKVYLGERFEL